MAEATQAPARAKILTKMALLGGVALTLAACQTSSGYDANGDLKTTSPMAKPNFPVRGEAAAKPAANLPVPPPSQAAAAPPPRAEPPKAEPPPVTAGIVESKSLPPPAPVAVTPPPPPPPPPAPVASPPMRTASVAPSLRSEPPAPIPPPRPSATGQVIGGQSTSSTTSMTTYTVKAGQGVDAVARDVGVSRQTLVEANDLKAPYALKAGEKLKVPGKTVTTTSSGGGKTAQYVVAQGDTLFSIAKRFDTTPAEMSSLNGMKSGESIQPGQKLTLPKKYQPQETRVAQAAPPPASAPSSPPPAAPPTRVASASPPPARPPVSATRPAPPPPAEVKPAAPQGAQVVTVPKPAAPTAPPASQPAGPAIGRDTASAAQVRAAGSGKFIWPVKGRVLTGFGPKADGQRSDGLDIAAPMNTPVRAAASGEVIYAGDVLREYGNLVLIQHPDGFVTAYGHLAKVNVKMKDKVSQDQEIGQVGDTGGVTQPQLHFETRYARSAADSPAPPVDPLLVLPNP